MARFRYLAISALAACHGQPSATAPATAPAPADRATVPLIVVGNRPLIDLTFHEPDGSTRVVRFLVDSGGGGFLLTEPVARELGLAWGETMHEDGAELAPITTPLDVSVDQLRLDTSAAHVIVMLGHANILPPSAPGHADGMFPGRLLAHYHVVFDYPKGTFTIAKAGVLVPRGDPMPMKVGKSSGFPRTEVTVDGVTHGFLLDTGASFTMVSEVLLKAWGAAHPDWQRHEGAFGEAATLGGQTLETMTVPAATWGQHALAELGVVSQHEGTFEQWMSSMMAAPIEGSLAGNVLKQFRIELDYPNETLYVSGP